MSRLAKIYDLADLQRHHLLASVGATALLTEFVIEIRGMFARGDPHRGAMVYSVQCARATDLAYIAARILVRCRIPVHRSPRGCLRIDTSSAHQHGDVLRIERVAAAAAVHPPQMVVVNLHRSAIAASCLVRKYLSVNRAVLLFDRRLANARDKLARLLGAIMARDHEGGHELYEQPLLQIVSQAIAIRVSIGGRSLSVSSPTKKQQCYAGQHTRSHGTHRHVGCRFLVAGVCTMSVTTPEIARVRILPLH